MASERILSAALLRSLRLAEWETFISLLGALLLAERIALLRALLPEYILFPPGLLGSTDGRSLRNTLLFTAFLVTSGVVHRTGAKAFAFLFYALSFIDDLFFS